MARTTTLFCPALALVFAAPLGCAPWPAIVTCEDIDACPTESTGPTSGANDSTDGIHTVTGDESTTGTMPPPTPTDDTGEPSAPQIVDVALTPAYAAQPGMIDVDITVAHATGVRMAIGDGESIELTARGPDAFGGAIPVFTALANGAYTAHFTPHQDDLDGETVPAPYEIALTAAGTQGFWESGDFLGPGRVAGILPTPTGHVVEFGTHGPADAPRCYLRRRDSGGAWSPDDVASPLPDLDCEALDLTLAADGALHLLARRAANGDERWWHARIPAWGEPAENLALGAAGEQAVALAAHPAGAVAVCGTAPTGEPDSIDAMAQIFHPNQPGTPWIGDYEPTGKPHQFAEQVADCVFSADALVVVGAANGWHVLENMPRSRQFVARLDLTDPVATWSVAGPGVYSQSKAQAVTLDDQQRLIVAGIECNDACAPEGYLRIYDAQETLVWDVSLGLFAFDFLAVQDVAWSPAEYVVVATGGLKGHEDAFTVRAFSTSQVAALWTFTREDLQALHFALRLAIGPFGQIYAGGFGEGYPAVAYIHG